MSQQFTIEEAESMVTPTTQFKCQLKANEYALQFLKFEIKDHDTKESFYTHEQEPLPNSEMLINDDDYDEAVLNAFDKMRMLNYSFSKRFLDSKAISSTLVFKVGDKEVKNLVIIDHFFFKGTLVKSFKFKFPFCAPNSSNEWEYIYDFPILTEEMKKDMTHSPGLTVSETFFFVGEKLVLHNKADYAFI